MDRRGFLGSLMAVTTAIAGGVKLPSGKEVAKAAPKAIRVQNDLLGLLKDCVPTRIEANLSINGPMTYTIEYLHAPGSKKTDTCLMIDGYTQGMRPVSVMFSHSVAELPRITVEWA